MHQLLAHTSCTALTLCGLATKPMTCQPFAYQGIVVFKIDDGVWTADLRVDAPDGDRLYEGLPKDEKPDITLMTSDANFAALVMGKLNPQQVGAFMGKKTSCHWQAAKLSERDLPTLLKHQQCPYHAVLAGVPYAETTDRRSHGHGDEASAAPGCCTA